MNASEREDVHTKLIELIRTHGPIGADGIAKLSGIKLSAAYQRIRALESKGVRLTASAVRTGSRGPHRTLYSLPDEVPPGVQLQPLG